MLRNLNCAGSLFAVLCVALTSSIGHAETVDFIQPTSVLSNSEGSFPEENLGPESGRVINLINGSGLSGTGPVIFQTHDNDVDYATMWLSGPNDGGLGFFGATYSANSQNIVFDLGEPYDLNGTYIWNFNQGGIQDGNQGTIQGVLGLAIDVSADVDPLTASFSEVSIASLREATGGSTERTQFFPLEADGVRLVRFRILSPLPRPIGAGLPRVGLSEVRFSGQLSDIIFADDFNSPRGNEPGPDDVVNGVLISDASDAATNPYLIDPFLPPIVISGSTGFSDDTADVYQITAGPGPLSFELFGLEEDLDLLVSSESPILDRVSTNPWVESEAVEIQGCSDDSYTVTVAPFLDARSEYQFTISGQATLGADQIPGDASTQAVLLAGMPLESALEECGDTDWFQVQLRDDLVYTISLTGLTLEDPFLAVYSAENEFLVSDNDSGDGLDARIRFLPPSDGLYYLSAEGFDLSDVGTYSIDANGEAVGEDDVIDGITVPEAGDTGPTSAIIPSPAFGAVVITGSAGFGDDLGDRYRFVADASGSASFDLSGLGENLNLALLDGNGDLIAESNIVGSGAESIGVDLVNGDTYFVDVSPSSSARSNYQLDLVLPENPGEDDVTNGIPVPEAGNTTASATVVEFDAVEEALVTGSVGFFGDTADVYRITLRPLATGTLVVDLSGLAADLDLFLLDNTGASLASSEVSGAEPELIEFSVAVPPGSTGQDYFIQVLPVDSARSGYNLFIDAPTPQEF